MLPESYSIYFYRGLGKKKITPESFLIEVKLIFDRDQDGVVDWWTAGWRACTTFIILHLTIYSKYTMYKTLLRF